MADRVLIVVAKKPEAGKTKTRLSPPLSQKQVVALYRCLLLDTLDLMQRVEGVDHVIAYTPTTAAAYFREIAPPGFTLVPQPGHDLGERLHGLLALYLRRGYQQAVVMSSDGPTLPASLALRAFEELGEPLVDVVLGPSDDGGYYLIGLKKPCRALFQVVMSTPTVLRETLEKAREQGLHATCLPTWYDIDTPEDLARLAAEVPSLPHNISSRTREFVTGLFNGERELLGGSAAGPGCAKRGNLLSARMPNLPPAEAQNNNKNE